MCTIYLQGVAGKPHSPMIMFYERKQTTRYKKPSNVRDLSRVSSVNHQSPLAHKVLSLCAMTPGFLTFQLIIFLYVYVKAFRFLPNKLSKLPPHKMQSVYQTPSNYTAIGSSYEFPVYHFCNVDEC
ncbi:hypothetical protein XENOCAPTIV_028632 [Xenoophorus captivus]|uniref:Uncharacterized protein n=1 Tax=Xenoophorus captivus TaxID=1517983 RepID=A0ABV0S5Y6_9TELE